MNRYSPLKKYTPPDEPGRFAAIRRHDRHTGIDLYCEQGDEVFAIENGVVVAIEDFTGPKAGSRWWHDTQAVLIEGASGVICYGEIEIAVTLGQSVTAGALIGRVKTVLIKDKGRPMNMLHLELYRHGTRETTWWHLGEDQPTSLLDPTCLLEVETLWLTKGSILLNMIY